MDKLFEKLLFEANKAASLSYAPYSKFRVGSAVLAEDKIYIGANIENASSNLGICAERIAIANAKINGAKDIIGIAIYCKDSSKDVNGKYTVEETMPCGGCLQWIAELAPNAWIITNAIQTPVYIKDLLPRPFKLNK